MATTPSKSSTSQQQSASSTPWLGREVITSDDVNYPEFGVAGEVLKTDRSTAVVRDGVTVLTNDPREDDEHLETVQENIARQLSQVGGAPGTGISTVESSRAASKQ